jgi:hypothetical protein
LNRRSRRERRGGHRILKQKGTKETKRGRKTGREIEQEIAEGTEGERQRILKHKGTKKTKGEG